MEDINFSCTIDLAMAGLTLGTRLKNNGFNQLIVKAKHDFVIS